jgi:hypothetical protein
MLPLSAQDAISLLSLQVETGYGNTFSRITECGATLVE